jgi:hypothetical protein
MDFRQLDPKYIVLAIVVIVAIIALAVVFARQRRAASARIRERFGPEYDRAVQELGSEKRAELNLVDRTKRVEGLNIRDLTPLERDHFTTQWNGVQMRFVDSPRGALAEADDLLMVVMQTRGYPMSDFEQRAADISVGYPAVVSNYRSAHAIALRLRNEDVSTEDQRKAMIHYRALFDEMVRIEPGLRIEPGIRRDVA